MKLAINAIMTRPGGALTVLSGMLAAWRDNEADVDVTVLTSAPAVAEIIEAGGYRCRIVLVPAGSGWRRLWWQRANLGRWLARYGCDVLLTNNHYLSDIPCSQVVHHHNLWRFITSDVGVPRSRRIGDRLRDRAARLALRHAAANVFVSDFLRAQAERFDAESHDRNVVVPNCLADTIVDQTPREAASHPVATRLVAVQSANPHKDNVTLVRTLVALVERAPDLDWRLDVAGSAGRADWSPIKELARTCRVADRIQWQGFVAQNDLRASLRGALCFVSTSRLESSGLTLLEAMAEGCPVVASQIPAYDEYASTAAALVPTGQADRFANTILKLHLNPGWRRHFVEAGIARIDEYRWSRWAPRFMDVLRQAAGRNV